MAQFRIPPASVFLALALVPALMFCAPSEDPRQGPMQEPAANGSESTPQEDPLGVAPESQNGATQDAAAQNDVTPVATPTVPVPELESAGKSPLRIVLSTYMEGHLEPCGCASAQSGGLDRRAFWLQSRKDLYDVILEGGNLVAGRTPFEELKLMTILQVLGANLAYPVLPLGSRDLELGAQALRDFDEAFGPPFVATDLRRGEGPGEAPFRTFGLVESKKAGDGKGYTICVLSLVGALKGEQPAKEGLRLLPPREAVATALRAAGTRGEAYDLVVVFTNAGGAQFGREIARTVPGVDLIVCTDSPEDEALKEYESYALRREDGSEHVRRVLFVGGRGKTLLIWTGEPAKDGAWITQKAEKVRLATPTADPEVRDVLLAFKRSLPDAGILEQMAEQRPSRNGFAYAGNDSCTMCHAEAARIWKGTAHAHAWESLVRRAERDQWPVTRHPECVSCHVAGYGEKTGFVTIEKTPELKDVGCESCHGPGSRHIRFWKQEAASLEGPAYDAAKKEATMGQLGMNSCFTCHTLEQSPGFLPQERWKLIEHK